MNSTIARLSAGFSGFSAVVTGQLTQAGFVDRGHVEDVLTTWPGGGWKLARYLGITTRELLKALGWTRFPRARAVVMLPWPHPVGGALRPRGRAAIGSRIERELPPMVSWIELFGAPRSQGALGSCTSFATVAALESRASDPTLDLSEAFLYALTKVADGIAAEGSTLDFATRVAIEYGTCTEDRWPYIDDFSHATISPSKPCFEEAEAHRCAWRTLLKPTDVRAIQSHLARGSVVPLSIPIFEATLLSRRFQSEGRVLGRLGAADTLIGGHAVTVVGYAEDRWLDTQGIPDAPGGGVFLARNSWGRDWAIRNPMVLPTASATRRGRVRADPVRIRGEIRLGSSSLDSNGHSILELTRNNPDHEDIHRPADMLARPR